MALWPMDKAMLEQVHLKVTVAVDKSLQQQVCPWRNWRIDKAPLGAGIPLRDCSL